MRETECNNIPPGVVAATKMQIALCCSSSCGCHEVKIVMQYHEIDAFFALSPDDADECAAMIVEAAAKARARQKGGAA